MSNPIQGATRTITDADLTVTTALPAAAANVDSASLDFGAASTAALENVELEISIPATPDLDEDKFITLKIEDSADDSSFAAIEELDDLLVEGLALGGPATTRKYRLPSSAKQYIRVNAAVQAAGGDNTGVSFTWRILA